MADVVGATLAGRYHVIARIAGGGMGDVYRGHDFLLDRPVAVKVLQPSLAGDGAVVDRFLQEARAAAKLVHPSVVGVYDWGAEDDRTYYMVMEYVAGTDLRDVLVARGSIEPAQAVEVMTHVCDALAVAHSEGLIHRDVKPENVLLSKTGRVKVADFGIAAIADADVTAPVDVLGTLRYVAPEQAMGHPATFASDIWAAGAVLSECLTGRPPLQGSGADLLRKRAEERPAPPSEIVPGIPADLDAIVLRACALDPSDRYQDASDMAIELRRVAVRSVRDAPSLESLLQDFRDDLPPLNFESQRRTRRPAVDRQRQSEIRRRFLRVVGLVCVVVLIAFAAVSGVRALVAPAMIDVPSLVELSKTDAKRQLESIGLTAKVVHRKDKFEARGEVLDQSPLHGTLEEGSIVTLTVSAGPPKVRVPSLIGMTLDEARGVVEDDARGMVLGDITEEYSSEDEGTIIGYSPSKWRLEWGSTIDVVVSRGPQPLDVPDVAGLPADAAVERLEETGFTTETIDSYSDVVPSGDVISTTPEAGDVVVAGSEIDVYVSIGPEFAEIEVPDVRGMTEDQARAQLEALGLSVRIPETCPGGSLVIETEPISGSMVEEGDEVALFVC
jgi:serine/threonine protein kinase/beta-lactam-binding protein with PASTA domain